MSPTPLRTYREEPPAAFDATQLVFAALVELEPGADDEVADGARDEHFARAGEGTDASTDVDGEPAHVAAAQLDLTGVQAGAGLEV